MDTLQQNIAKAIVNIFETGRLKGDYGRVTVAANDRGHLTYGRSQTTLASGNLYVLLSQYCGALGAAFAPQLQEYLPRIQARDLTLDGDMNLRHILTDAGADPVMQTAQDGFFDRGYWQPANRLATAVNVAKPLGVAVVYDSVVHGSFQSMKAATNASLPASPAEQDWIRQYVAIRRAWLANNQNVGLRPTIYRMDEFKKLIDAGNWNLQPDVVVRGITISAKSFEKAAPDAQGSDPVRASAHDPDEVMLTLQVPYQRGPAVEFLQHALERDGLLPVDSIDGVFGPLTAELVKAFQTRHGLTADGVVGPATWSVVHDVMAA